MSFEKLIVIDFDSTLFFSPLPNPKIWSSSFIAYLIANHWFVSASTLSPPLVPLSPPKEYFYEPLVELVQNKSEKVMVILLTGRSTAYEARVKQIVSWLPFDKIILKDKIQQTLEFKHDIVSNIIKDYPSIKSIDIYDDRKHHLDKFNFAVKTNCHHIIHDPEFLLFSDIDSEIKFVNSFVPNIQEMVVYTGIFLVQESIDLLKFLFKRPRNIFKTISNHVTISLHDSIAKEIVSSLGGLGAQVELVATHVGFIQDKVIAVKVKEVNGRKISDNEVAHVTVFVANGVSSKESNKITNWKKMKRVDLRGVIREEKKLGVVKNVCVNIAKEVSIGELVKKHHDVSGVEVGKLVAAVEEWMREAGVENVKSNVGYIEDYVMSM